MPTIVLTAQGKVTGLWGSAIIKGADGHAHPLKLGDIVRRGDVILTTQDGIVELTSDGSTPAVAATTAVDAVTATAPVETKASAPAPRSEVDQVIEKLARNDADAATAAGLAGGDGGEFLPGLRVERISESLTTLGLNNNEGTAQARAAVFVGAAPLAAAGANIAPSALDGSFSGPENTTLPVALRGIDSDGNVVSVTVTRVPTGGALLLADGITSVSAGQTLTPAQAAGLLFKPATDFIGQAVISFFVTDNQGATSNGATVSLNLLDTNPQPNQPPVAVNDSATTAEDTPATGNVLGNDSDPEGNTLAVTQFSLDGVTYAAGATAVVTGVGSLTLAANGVYTFTPAANYNGPVPVATYTVSDGAASVTATLTLTVSPVPDAPVATPDTVPALEDQPVVFDPRSNDSNIDGTPLSITAIGGQPIAIGTPVVLPQGTVSLNADGTLTFTPNPNVNGPVIFDYTVSNAGATSTSQVTVNIAPVNDAPVAVNDLASTPVNTATTIAALANDSDVDGNPLVVTSAFVDPTLGTVTVNPNGTLAFNPANNVSGPVVIQYTISDGQGGVASAVVTVNVGPNTPPEGSDATVTLAEDGSRSFSAADFGFSDADAGQSFANVRIDTLPAAGSFTLSGVAVAAGQVISVANLANLLFTPAPNANGNGYASFSFSVQDSAGAFDTAPNQITVNVSAVNDPPIAVATPASGNEDAAGIPVLLGGTDIDGSISSFTITSLPANGVLIFGGVAVTLGQNIPATGGSATLSFVPAANFNGNTAFDFTATDNEGAVSPSVNVPIAVAPVNDAPVAVDDLASTPINTATTISVLANDSDVDGNALTVTAATVDPARGTVTINPDGTLAFTPAGNVSGPVLVSYTISDGQGGFASATVTVNVGPNTPPTGTDALVVIAEDGTRSFSATDFGFSDADAGQSLANVRIDTLPSAGSLTLSGAPVAAGQVIALADLGNLVFAPAANGNGAAYASFTFSVQDSGGAFDAAPNQITIDVRPVADPAVIGGTAIGATVEDTARTTGGALTVTDPDAGEAAFNPLTQVPGAHGSFSIDAAGVWTYTLNNADPAVQALGAGQTLPNETFTVTTIDGTSQVVTVTVTGTNDAPVAQAASAAVDEDAPLLLGTVTATDVDANAALSFSLNATPPAGLTFNPNGSYSFDASNPAYQSLTTGQQQVLTVPYTVTDDQGAASTANLVITITGTNDGPVAVNDSASTPINTPLASIDVLANDSDLDGGALTVTAASLVDPALGSVAINPDGTLAFAPASNVSGPVVVNYTVSDGQGGFSNATLTVTVGANTPPAGSDTAVTLAEDTSRSFSAADFGYSDADVGQSFAQVRIDTLPAAGALALNGVAAVAGQVVAVADLGNLVFTPAPNANGSAYAGFDFSVQDSAGAFDPVPNHLAIAVSAVNDAPVASGSATLVAIDEDNTNPPGASVGNLFAAHFSDSTDQVSGGSSANTLVGIAISGHTVDASRGNWQYSTDGGSNWTALPTGSNAAAVTLTTSDLLRFLPAANFNGSATPLDVHLIESGGAAISSGATVDLSAGTGGSTVYSASTVAVNETINPVNDAPVAVNDQFTTAEDVPLTITLASLLANDSDVDGNPLTVISAVSAVGGTLDIVAGNLVFTPNPNYFGPASFTYGISDGQGGTATATVNIDVTPVNDAPVNTLPASPYAATEDTRVTIAGVSVSDPDEASGIAAQKLATVQLDVSFGTLRVTLADGTSISAGAIDSGTLTLSGTQAAINSTLASLSYQGNANFNGNDTLKVRSIDASGLVDNDTLTIAVAAVNDPPVAVNDQFTTAEDVPLSIIPSALTTNDSDVDGNPLQVYSIANPSGGTLSFDGTNIIFTPTPNYFGPASFTYAITDGQGGSSTATVNIDVTPVNDAPVASGSATLAAIAEDDTSPPGATVASLFGANFSDAADGTAADSLAGIAISGLTQNAAKGSWQYSSDGGSTWGALPDGSSAAAVTLAGSDRLRFVPVANYNGVATPLNAHLIETGGVAIVSGGTVDLAAGTGGSTVYSAATVSLNETINPVNDPPVANTDSFTTPEDQPLTITLASLLANDTDVDGDTLTLQSAQSPVHGQLSAVAGNIVFTPDANYFGPASFSYTINDGHGGTTNGTVNINVTPVNDAPINTLPTSPFAAVEDTRVSITSLSVSDADETSGIAAQKLATVQLTVANGTLRVTLDPGASFSAGANDSGSFTLSGTQAAINSTLASLSYQGNANFNGNDTLKVQSVDASGLVDNDTLTIAVAPVNDPPVANTDSFTTPEDQPLTITLASLLANDTDVDGDTLTLQSAQSPVHGQLSAVAGNIVFTPDANYFGPASFSYTINDGHGGTTNGTVNINVTPVNDAPVARPDEGSVTAAQTLIVSAAEGVIQSTSTPAGRDTDVEGDALSVTKVSAGTGAPTTVVPNGGVTIAGAYGDLLLRNDGSYKYTASRADAVATGTQVNDVFTYQVSDGNGGFATASLTLHVAGVADTLSAAPPTTTALTATLGLNGEYYGYNDFNPGPTSPNRRHADDGVFGNLDRAADVTSIVNGRNAAFGGGAVAGSSAAADANAADARFLARTVDYGTSTAVTASLGTNPNIAPGGSIAGLDNNNSQMYKFLNRVGGSDAGTITVGQGTGDNDQIGGGPTSGLGRTSDAAMRLSGEAYLAAGLYDIRVYADDGFRLKLDDQTVALFDNIQSPTTRVYNGVAIEGGLTPLELLYWEQGGNAVLRVEFKLSGTADATYQVLGSQNLPLFSDANAPVLSDLQDLVAGSTPGSYLVRTGSLLDGGNGDDTLNGSAGRDILIGGQGKDTLSGGAGDDLIRGGAGDDQLTGGAGHDVFRWSLGDAGTASAPARDVITDFDNTPHSGDVLDLRDLLVGESHAANTVSLPATIGLNNALTITPHEGNLANYLHFSAVGGNTVVEISSTGGFASSYTPAAVDQVITLTGLNLVGSFSNDHQVINDLLQRGKLVTD